MRDSICKGMTVVIEDVCRMSARFRMKDSYIGRVVIIEDPRHFINHAFDNTGFEGYMACKVKHEEEFIVSDGIGHKKGDMTHFHGIKFSPYLREPDWEV